MKPETVANTLLIIGALFITLGIFLSFGLSWACIAAGVQSLAAGGLIAYLGADDAGP